MRRLGLVLMVAAVLASGQPPRPWWENPIGNGLTLTDRQRERVNWIAAEYRDRLTAERQDVERAEREFESVLNAEVLDLKKCEAAIEQVVKARGVFAQDISTMTLRLRRVLTAEQWRMLQSQRDDDKGRPDGRGRRGGPR